MRLVIKIGTSLLTDADGQLDRSFLKNIVEQIASLHSAGHEVVVVSSGAVAAGRTKIAFEKEKKNIPFRQALAAVGQTVLVEEYSAMFAPRNIVTAQALLTNFDFVNRENFLNVKNVFDLLLARKVIPIVNENDVTSIAELKFGDNDMLSAKTAALVMADYLWILTDVDGLYREDPRENPKAEFVPIVERVDDEIKAMATDTTKSKSMGGMVTKLLAAEYVASVGIPMVIAHGKSEKVVQNILEFCTAHSKKSPLPKMTGTAFLATTTKTESRKRWLKPQLVNGAAIIVDDGATDVLLTKGKSLLPSGVIEVRGEFGRGDVVMISNTKMDIGYGQVNYSSLDIDKIKKSHTKQIEVMLGYHFGEEVIHRDRMVILER